MRSVLSTNRSHNKSRASYRARARAHTHTHTHTHIHKDIHTYIHTTQSPCTASFILLRKRGIDQIHNFMPIFKCVQLNLHSVTILRKIDKTSNFFLDEVSYIHIYSLEKQFVSLSLFRITTLELYRNPEFRTGDFLSLSLSLSFPLIVLGFIILVEEKRAKQGANILTLMRFGGVCMHKGHTGKKVTVSSASDAHFLSLPLSLSLSLTHST